MEPGRVVCHGHRHRDRRPEFGPNQVRRRRVFHEHLGAFASAQRNVGDHEFRGGLRYSHAAVLASFVDTTWMACQTRVNQQKGALTASGSWTGPISPLAGRDLGGERVQAPQRGRLGQSPRKGRLCARAQRGPQAGIPLHGRASGHVDVAAGSDVLVVQGAAFASCGTTPSCRRTRPWQATPLWLWTATRLGFK